MRKNNRKCICCGKVYTYCPNCGEFAHLERWHSLYENANCKALFDITTDYYAKEIDALEAKKRFEKCDLSYAEKLNKSIIEAMKEVGVTLEDKKVDDKTILKDKVKNVVK